MSASWHYNEAMKRVVLLLLSMVLVSGLVTILLGRLTPAQRVYSVSEVATGLAHHPSAWIGRTILIRGVVASSSWSTGLGTREGRSCFRTTTACPLITSTGNAVSLLLVDETLHKPVMPFLNYFLLQQYKRHHYLYLALRVPSATPDPFETLMRHIPLLGHLIPARRSGSAPGDVPTVYRIQVQPTSRSTFCNWMDGGCTSGLLVDVQP